MGNSLSGWQRSSHIQHNAGSHIAHYGLSHRPHSNNGHNAHYGIFHRPSSNGRHGAFRTSPSSLKPDPVEHLKPSTIHNNVNLKKSTLCLEEDECNPGFFLVAFSFDAVEPGRICIFFHAKEGQDCSLYSVKPHPYNPLEVSFDKGLDQKFRQPSGTGVNLSVFDDKDLLKVGPDEVYPLVIRVETQLPNVVMTDTNKVVGAPLPKLVCAQTTLAVLETKGSIHHVKVLKQMIWVNGVRYELQEIYGIENLNSYDSDGDEVQKECVICMTDPCDTTILPCRHMCLCRECSKVLKYHKKPCPVCRGPVWKFVEINVPLKEGEQG